MNRRALEGLKVLDLSNLLAGPMSTMHLADHGAEVIKVEHPRRGDEMRRWGRKKDGVGLFFKVINRNKKSITLDLSSPEGREIVLKLVKDVDVVVENFRTGTLERWGLGYEDLKAASEDIIVLHVTGFGRSGPRREEPGFGSLVEAYAGAAYINGHADREPLIQPFGLGDSSAAIFGAFAILAAIFNRDNGGGGQEIDLALYDGLFTMLGPHVINYDQLGEIQERYGADNPFVSPRGTFLTQDGHWIAVSGSTQVTFERVCHTIDAPELVDDPRFASNSDRIANGEQLTEILATRIATFDRADLLAKASELQATIGPVNSVSDVLADPQIIARENVVTVPDDELGSIRMQNVAVHLLGTPGVIDFAGAPQGAFNEEIYQGKLGLDAAQIESLEEKGVI